MKLFFFDTETTGTNPGVDHIIQFGGIYGTLDEYTKEFKQEAIINQLINVDVVIPSEATAIHGIKNEDLVGYDYIDEYIYEFLGYLKKADIVVGHNVTFDIGMLKGETDRLGIPFDYKKLKLIDTMKSTVNITKIPNSYGGYKWPNLMELYIHLFGRPFENAHDAMADIQATKDCFIKLFNDFEYDDGIFKQNESEDEIEKLSKSSCYRDFAHNSDFDRSSNKEAMDALALLNEGKKSIFLTGKAGTGKSTLIRGIIEVNKELNKFPVVLGTTGISALNIGGKTVHSFFGLGRNDIYYKDIAKIRKIKISATNKKLLKYAPFIIIDEVSMLSSNVLDVVDALMRKTLYNDSPFGGKQIIFVGDIYQLPPVCKREWTEKFGELYKSEWFFHSEVFKKLQYEMIELTHNYRQNEDIKLSTILDDIREDKVSNYDINELNSCRNNKIDEDAIVLFSHNSDVDYYNSLQLSKLPGIEYEIESKTFEDFPDSMKPVQELISIKEGAKIMMVTNDINKRWVNGSIGIITKILNDGDDLRIKIEIEGKEYEIEKYTWENAPLFYNETKGEFEEKILGTYTQLPIKLAYAITIHKSQGLTFEHCRMDISKVFVGGQAYTALSRVKSLSGLSISGFVSKDRLYFDPRIKEFKINIEISKERKKICNETYMSSLVSNYTKALYDGGNTIYIQCFGYGDKIKTLLNKFTNHIKEYFHQKYGYNVLFFFEDDTYNFSKTSNQIVNSKKSVEEGTNEVFKDEDVNEKKQGNTSEIEDDQPELDKELFEKLKKLRNEITGGKTVYIFANDAVLKLLASYKPVNKEQFVSIPGLKERKYELYGKEIINLIISHLKNDGIDIDEHGKKIFEIRKNRKIKEVTESSEKSYMERQKEKHENAYAKRTEDDDQKLINLFDKGKSIKDLSVIFQRNYGGIRSRLKKLGLIE